MQYHQELVCRGCGGPMGLYHISEETANKQIDRGMEASFNSFELTSKELKDHYGIVLVPGEREHMFVLSFTSCSSCREV